MANTSGNGRAVSRANIKLCSRCGIDVTFGPRHRGSQGELLCSKCNGCAPDRLGNAVDLAGIESLAAPVATIPPLIEPVEGQANPAQTSLNAPRSATAKPKRDRTILWITSAIVSAIAIIVGACLY